MRNALVSGAQFEGADLRGCDLGGLQFTEARQFRGATISPQQATRLLNSQGLIVVS